MKLNLRGRATRTGVSAMAPVLGMLVAAALAKFAAATQILHLSH